MKSCGFLRIFKEHVIFVFFSAFLFFSIRFQRFHTFSHTVSAPVSAGFSRFHTLVACRYLFVHLSQRPAHIYEHRLRYLPNPGQPAIAARLHCFALQPTRSCLTCLEPHRAASGKHATTPKTYGHRASSCVVLRPEDSRGQHTRIWNPGRWEE